MDYGDYYWGLCRGYYRDPFPHSLLSTRQIDEKEPPKDKVFRALELWDFGRQGLDLREAAV